MDGKKECAAELRSNSRTEEGRSQVSERVYFRLDDGEDGVPVEGLQKEKSELEYAILLSKQRQEELDKQAQQEDAEFLEALRLSELSYKLEQERISQQANVEAKGLPEMQTPTTIHKPNPNAIGTKVQNAPGHPLQLQLQKEKEIMSMMNGESDKKPVSTTNTSNFSALPALNMKGTGLGFKKLPDVAALEKRRDEVVDAMDKKREEETNAALEERKRRILEQREKLQEQKRLERENQLLKYEEIKVSRL